MSLPTIDTSNPAVEAFLKNAHRHTFKNREVIVRPGDPADTLYYIIEGSVTVSLENEDGNDLILDYLNAGSFIGELGLFVTQESRQATVTAKAPCVVAGITYEQLNTLAQGALKEHYANILHSLATQLSHRLLATARKASHLAYIGVSGRIAHTLLDLCKEPEAMTHPDGMQIRITRTDLGRIAGCSREMAGRVLKSMEEQELITVKGKTIVVFDAR